MRTSHLLLSLQSLFSSFLSLLSLFFVLIMVCAGCDGDKSVVEQLRDANIILHERDEVIEEVGSLPTKAVEVMFNLGSKAVNDVAAFKTIYVAPCEVVDKILNGEKQYHIQQLTECKLALGQLSKELAEENETRERVGAEIDGEFPGMKAAADAITNRNSQLTSRQKIKATKSLLGEYDLYMVQIDLRLNPICVKIQQLEDEIKTNQEKIEVLQRSFEDMTWFGSLPVTQASRFSVSAQGACTINVPASVDSYIWTTAVVAAENMPFDQEFRWFLRCPEAIDDAGILPLTTANGIVNTVAKARL